MIEIITKENASPVSVIVPVYNGKTTLAKCLDSIEKQDYPLPLEVIIIDDGSTDKSGEYAESKGFKVLRQQNQGPSLARNNGAKLATGELLVFTDADCVLDENFVTKLVKPLLNSDIVGSQGIFYSRQKNLVSRFIQFEILERIEKQNQAKYIDWVATYAACYNKEIFF
jgi:glycosyltransferase involved in cell wall biosynthesis